MCSVDSTVKRKLTFFNDPGHAWLEVDRVDLLASGVADKISSYSYQKDGKVYLEEDCDAPLYLASLDCIPELVEKYTDNPSPIRNYSAFTVNTGEAC